MSARAIVSGVLHRAPQAKTSKAGKRYALATIREGGGADAARWWSAFGFNESVADELMRLREGDPVAVSGAFDCEIYRPEGGEARLNWRIVADAVLTARPVRKKRTQDRGSAPPDLIRGPAQFAWEAR